MNNRDNNPSNHEVTKNTNKTNASNYKSDSKKKGSVYLPLVGP